MKSNVSFLNVLADGIGNALSKFRGSSENAIVTDIYLQPLSDSSELIVYDDDEVLATLKVPELNEVIKENFYAEMEKILRKALQQIDVAYPLGNLSIWKPFSFVMVDEDKETYYELMLIDDDTVLVSQTLLEGLDKELDDFLSDLLEN